MKKKLICSLLMVTMLSTALAACGKKETSAPTNEETVSEPEETEEPVETATPEPTEEAEAAPAETSGGLSDDLYSFQIQLNDTVYTLPAQLSEFTDNGWTLEDDGELEPNQKTLTNVAKNGEAQVYFSLVNTQSDVLPFAECQVGQVTVDDYQAESGATIVLPKGISLGSSYEEVIEAYGEASDLYESDTRKSLTYSIDTYASVGIDIDVETNKVSRIDVENLIAKEKAAEVSDEDAPELLKNYQAPADLGDDFTSFNVKYDGALYTLPAPVTAFIENGWSFVSDENEMIAAKSSNVRFSMRKGNQVLDTTVHNYDSSEQPAKFCFVTRVEYYNLGAQLPLELPKGISEKSSYEDIVNAYGEPAKTEDSSSYTYYEYGKYSESITFMFGKESNAIEKIEVVNSPKELSK